MKQYFLLFLLMGGLGACGPSIPDGFFNSPYGEYSPQAVDYFLEIGLCPEFGVCQPSVRRWNSEVRIQMHGAVSAMDKDELSAIISELSQLTRLNIREVTDNSANINIYFVAQQDFKKYITQYDTFNPQDGVFTTVYDNSGRFIVKAAICIDNAITGIKRRHLLREELTQTLGLQNDSDMYQNSVFQQDPQYMPVAYSQVDKQVIRMLYDQKIQPGMNKEQVRKALTVTSSGGAVAEADAKGLIFPSVFALNVSALKGGIPKIREEVLPRPV